MSPITVSGQPISNLLTVIITTSPTPSAPSTELISAILSSFRSYCTTLLFCRVIVVFDTYDRIASHARLKKGQVTPEGAKTFDLYKQEVRELILGEFVHDDKERRLDYGQGKAEFGYSGVETNFVPFSIAHTVDKRVIFIEPSKRLGFGLAIRSALRLTETPFAWVQQHDWPLISDVPIEPLLDVMWATEDDESAPVKYVCLPSIRLLSYADSAHVARFPELKGLTSSLKRDFITKSGVNVPLTPMFFWHDKPHLVSTQHYLSRIFPTRLSIPRGAFIEDTVGQRARNQMKQGDWIKWATWLYYPEDGQRLCLRHLQGRTWQGSEKELEKKALWRDRNAKQSTTFVNN
ncbi:putative feruloyl esterase-like protein [Daldinia childiae]|uniref:putative feruloyl esterase-like protein n=1 Tax=Daldinia childiae TaxID=326645 RepID=UPI001447B2DF|nr:putative feruloyl esterase-like protein [Daldinia childiae]KAF3054839.1 putative feruloyl esterase-like protein [Daldinia childiae]